MIRQLNVVVRHLLGQQDDGLSKLRLVLHGDALPLLNNLNQHNADVSKVVLRSRHRHKESVGSPL